LDIQPWHLIVLLIIVLLLFGAKRLPEVGRSLGSSAREFKKGISGDETPPPAESVDAAPHHRLPEVGRTLGDSAREFKKGLTGDETPPPAESADAAPKPVDTHDVEQH
jgi:sec-independent protein translocase protein TatA